jgi:hypothetical protein
VFGSLRKTLKNHTCRFRLEEEGMKVWWWSGSSSSPGSSLWGAGASVVCLPQWQFPTLSIQAHLQSYRMSIKFAQSIHLSVLMKQLDYHREFSWNFVLGSFNQIWWYIQVLEKIWKRMDTLLEGL